MGSPSPSWGTAVALPPSDPTKEAGLNFQKNVARDPVWTGRRELHFGVPVAGEIPSLPWSTLGQAANALCRPYCDGPTEVGFPRSLTGRMGVWCMPAVRYWNMGRLSHNNVQKGVALLTRKIFWHEKVRASQNTHLASWRAHRFEQRQHVLLIYARRPRAARTVWLLAA